MRLAFQAMLGVALFAAVPATAAIFKATDWAGSYRGRQEQGFAGATVKLKDATRLPNDGSPENDRANLLVELAQASGGSGWPAPPLRGAPDLPPPPFGAPPMGAGAIGPSGPHGMRPLFTRLECEESINRRAALAGYLKSKLRLDQKQKDAWQRLEQAVEPAIEKFWTACEQLPIEISVPPLLPDAVDMMQRQLSAEAELLQALREPLRALYETLSPEQRSALVPPPPPGPLP